MYWGGVGQCTLRRPAGCGAELGGWLLRAASSGWRLGIPSSPQYYAPDGSFKNPAAFRSILVGSIVLKRDIIWRWILAAIAYTSTSRELTSAWMLLPDQAAYRRPWCQSVCKHSQANGFIIHVMTGVSMKIRSCFVLTWTYPQIFAGLISVDCIKWTLAASQNNIGPMWSWGSIAWCLEFKQYVTVKWAACVSSYSPVGCGGWSTAHRVLAAAATQVLPKRCQRQWYTFKDNIIFLFKKKLLIK